MRRLWDISPPISSDTPAFPGDTTYAQRWNAQIGPGCPVNVSAITMSPHLGAHADAPLHYGRDASAIGQVDLQPFLGPCRVIHAIDRGALIRPEHLSHAADGLPPRVLVRTCVMAPPAWSPAFSAFAPETITWLARHGVRLVGIDDVDYARLLPVPLTTLRQPTHQIGDTALSIMLERVARRDLVPRHVYLQAKLVIRASCGAQKVTG